MATIKCWLILYGHRNGVISISFQPYLVRKYKFSCIKNICEKYLYLHLLVNNLSAFNTSVNLRFHFKINFIAISYITTGHSYILALPSAGMLSVKLETFP